jgi:hypothetical protein
LYAKDKGSRSGALEPLRDRALISQANGGAASLFVKGCCILQFNQCASFAFGDQLCEDIYATGIAPWPVEGRMGGGCSPSWRRLGIPCPEAPPSASGGGTMNEKAAPRSYAYSFVNSAGREGMLSPASNVVIAEDGQAVTVSGWSMPAAEWDVIYVRVYRAVSGVIGDIAMDAKKMQVNDPDTVWMYVGQTSGTSFTDSKLGEELTESVIPEYLPPPPEDLKGITYLGLANIWVGFSGKTVYFSKNNNPDAWPHYFTLDDEIRAITTAAGMVFVSTCGHPYAIEGHTSCKDAPQRTVIRSHFPAPAANMSERAIAPVGGGAIFPSYEGLMYIDKVGNLLNVTAAFYSDEEWGRLAPDSMLPVWHDGRILLFGRYKSLQFGSTATTSQWQWEGLTELSDIDVIDWKISDDGRLILLTDNGVYQWEASTSYREYHWISYKMFAPSDTFFSAVMITLVEPGNVQLKIFADDRLVLDRHVVRTETFLLPSWAHGTQWHYELKGTAKVGKISLAPLRSQLR